MGISFNPLIFSGLINIPPAGAVTWRGSVPSEVDLPTTGNSLGDAIAVQDTGKVYVWSGAPQKWHDTGINVAAFGTEPTPEGYKIVVDDSSAAIRKDTLVLEPADETNPGGVSVFAQSFSGDKTFKNNVIVEGEIDAQTGINSTTGTLTLGSTTTSVEIGGTSSSVIIDGSTIDIGDPLSTNTISGVTTFTELVESEGGLDAQGGIDSTTGTLDLGTGTAAVNIGDAAGTTDIVGTVTIEYNPADTTDWSPVPTHVIEGLDQLAARFVEQDEATNEPTGFPNRDDSELLFNDNAGNPIFTIQPKAPATSYDVYIRGRKFTKSAALTITSTSHPSFPYAGNNYIYFDNSGNLQVTNSFTPAIIQQYAFISIVYWNPETNSHTYFAEERHGITMDGATHSYLHTVFGARFLSGLALQNFTAGSGTANADAQFDADQGTIRDEDILLQIPSQAQIPILYRQGTNSYWRKKAADAFPVIYSGTAGYTGANGRLPYNLYSGGTWSLSEVANSKYVLVHFFATNDIENGVVGIQGIEEHDSIEAARTAANTEITSLSGLPFAEFVPIGSVLFQTANGFTNTPKADVIPVDGANYVDFRGTQLYTPAGTATTHGLLSGLGNDDHFQYLLVDGTRAMSGDLDMGVHKIENVVDPTLAQDASTKAYTDQAEADANAYTDAREIAITAAYEAYTDAEITLLKLPEAQRKHVNYVSGNDTTGNGSILSPWKTVSYACTQITDATTSKRYVIEFDGVGTTDVVSLPSFVAIVGKNVTTSQIGTINCTLPAASTSLNTVMNATITNYNLDSTAITSQQSTRIFNCSILNLNCVGKAIGGNQVLLYSTDVLNQLHFKGGYLQVAAPNYLQRVRIFHTTNGGSTNYALIQGGQHASQAGTWISGNGTLQLIGGVSMNVPVVTWGEVSTGVFRGRAAPYSGVSNTWTTDVTISIQNAATEIILTGDGVKTINTLISDWNTANPTNLMTLVEGAGNQVVISGTEIIFLNGAKPSILFDSSSYVTESAAIQGPVTVVPNARPEGIRYDDRARASYYGFRFYAQNYGSIGNNISLNFFRDDSQTGTTQISSIVRSGTRTTGSPNITALSTTSDLFPGMKVTGTGIPAGTRILTILSGSSVQLTANATTSGGANYTFNGNDVINNLTSTSNLAVGMSVVCPMVASTVTISNIFNTTTILTSAIATSSATNKIIFGYPVDKVVTTWNTANPSNTVVYSSNGDATARGYGVILPTATITLSGGGLFTDTSPTFSLQNAIVQLGQSAQAAVLKAELGIMRTTFSGVDNQAIPDDIDNFVFSNASNNAFEAFISITRGSTYAEYSLKGIKTASSWLMSQDYMGDDTGVAFSITSAGQIQYTSTATGTTPSFIFRAFRI